MTFAEDKTYKYICHHHSSFCRVDVLEILPFLPCLTANDQDRLRASYTRLGNRDTLWDLFNSLQRRTGWVDSFIQGLRACQLPELADQVAGEYLRHLPRAASHPGAPPGAPSLPAANIPAPAANPSIPHAGHREEPSYPLPVQDTQPPKSPGEGSEQTPPTPSSGAILRTPSVTREPSSSDPAALGPPSTSRPQEQDTDLASTPTAGSGSSPAPPRGPVSPSVSFQPLPRSTPRTSRLPGPAASVSSAGTSSPPGLAAGQGAGVQAKATICSSDTVPASAASSRAPSNAMSGDTVAPAAPASSTFTSTVPSKLPTSAKPTGAASSNVLPSVAPSKLPVSSAGAGTVSPKVPAGTAPTKTPASTAPTIKSSTRAAGTPVAPAPRGATGGSEPWPDGSSGGLHSGPELSKPGVLASQLDSQPFSGCSADLAISPSNSLLPEPSHGPEENEYVSVGTFGLHVVECPSADLESRPGLSTTQQAPQPTDETVRWVWAAPLASWFGAAVASALVATLLAVLYRRRLLH